MTLSLDDLSYSRHLFPSIYIGNCMENLAFNIHKNCVIPPTVCQLYFFIIFREHVITYTDFCLLLAAVQCYLNRWIYLVVFAQANKTLSIFNVLAPGIQL